MPPTLQDIANFLHGDKEYQSLPLDRKRRVTAELIDRLGMTKGEEDKPGIINWIVEGGLRPSPEQKMEFVKRNPFFGRTINELVNASELGYSSPDVKERLEASGERLGGAQRFIADLIGASGGLLPYFAGGEAMLAKPAAKAGEAIASKLAPAMGRRAFSAGVAAARNARLTEALSQGISGAIIGAVVGAASKVPGFEDQFDLDTLLPRLKQAGWDSAAFGALGTASPYVMRLFKKLLRLRRSGVKVVSKDQINAMVQGDVAAARAAEKGIATERMGLDQPLKPPVEEPLNIIPTKEIPGDVAPVEPTPGESFSRFELPFGIKPQLGTINAKIRELKALGPMPMAERGRLREATKGIADRLKIKDEVSDFGKPLEVEKATKTKTKSKPKPGKMEASPEERVLELEREQGKLEEEVVKLEEIEEPTPKQEERLDDANLRLDQIEEELTMLDEEINAAPAKELPLAEEPTAETSAPFIPSREAFPEPAGTSTERVVQDIKNTYGKRPKVAEINKHLRDHYPYLDKPQYDEVRNTFKGERAKAPKARKPTTKPKAKLSAKAKADRLAELDEEMTQAVSGEPTPEVRQKVKEIRSEMDDLEGIPHQELKEETATVDFDYLDNLERMRQGTWKVLQAAREGKVSFEKVRDDILEKIRETLPANDPEKTLDGFIRQFEAKQSEVEKAVSEAAEKVARRIDTASNTIYINGDAIDFVSRTLDEKGNFTPDDLRKLRAMLMNDLVRPRASGGAGLKPKNAKQAIGDVLEEVLQLGFVESKYDSTTKDMVRMVNKILGVSERGGVKLSPDEAAGIAGSMLYKRLTNLKLENDKISLLVHSASKGRMTPSVTRAGLTKALGRLTKNELKNIEEFMESIKFMSKMKGVVDKAEYDAVRNYAFGEGSLFHATAKEQQTFRKLLGSKSRQDAVISNQINDFIHPTEEGGLFIPKFIHFRAVRQIIDQLGLYGPSHAANKAYNKVSGDLFRELHKIFGLSGLVDQPFRIKVGKMLEGKLPLAGKAGEVAGNLRRFSDYLFRLFGIEAKAPYVKNYMPRIIDFKKLESQLKRGVTFPPQAESILKSHGIKIDYNDPTNMVKQMRRTVRGTRRGIADEVGFWSEHPRTESPLSQFLPTVQDPLDAMRFYIRYGTRKKFMQPLLDLYKWQLRTLRGQDVSPEQVPVGLKKFAEFDTMVGKGGKVKIEQVKPDYAGTDEARALAGYAEEYISSMLGRRTFVESEVDNAFRDLVSTFGGNVSPSTTSAVSRLFSDTLYVTMLGLPRLGSAVKNLTQQGLVMATEGSQWWAIGSGLARDVKMRQIFTDIVGEQAPVEMLGAPTEGFARWRVVVKGFLTLFRHADRYNRLVSFLAGRERALFHGRRVDAKALGEHLRRLGAEEISPKDIPKFYNRLANRAKLGSSERQVFRILAQTDLRGTNIKMLRALRNGDLEEFANLRGDFVQAQTQYMYGSTEAASIYRHPLGRIFGVFTSWPMNYAELLYGLSKQFIHGNVRPLITIPAIAMGAMKLGDLMHAEFSSWFGLGPFGALSDSFVWQDRIQSLLRGVLAGEEWLKHTGWALRDLDESIKDIADAFNLPFISQGVRDIYRAGKYVESGDAYRAILRMLGITPKPARVLRATRPYRPTRQPPVHEPARQNSFFEEMNRRLQRY